MNVRSEVINAWRLFEAGDKEAAKNAAIQLIQKYPNDPLPLICMAEIPFNQDNYAEAEPWFRKVLAIAPDHEIASLGLFHSLWGLHRLNEALDEMMRFRALSTVDAYKEIFADIKSLVEEGSPVQGAEDDKATIKGYSYGELFVAFKNAIDKSRQEGGDSPADL